MWVCVGGGSNLYRARGEVVLISIGGGEVLTCTEHRGEVLLIYTECGGGMNLYFLHRNLDLSWIEKKNYIAISSFEDMLLLKSEREKYKLYNDVLVNYMPQQWPPQSALPCAVKGFSWVNKPWCLHNNQNASGHILRLFLWANYSLSYKGRDSDGK